MTRVFSGVRSSGRLHIGNYFGAIKSWIDLQNKHESIFAVVDYHAITTPYNPKGMKRMVWDTILDFLAAGLNPKKTSIIIQSQIPEHTELAWIFNTLTPVSWLDRLPTYREKIEAHPQNANMGLLDYPVLMAADILIYKADIVPVGEDQIAHIDLANEIVKRFNYLYGPTFSRIKPFFSKGARIMSLSDPTKKMSKTGGEGIGLYDEPEEIRDKIKKAVTDSGREIIMREDKPAISNLLLIYHLFSGKSIKAIEKKYQDKGYADFKKDLAEIIVKGLEPFRQKRKELEKKPRYVKKVVASGVDRARKIASKNLLEIKRKIGLI
ncbi:MAG: tryptophan--tRNA ligase [Parcubacteria group bacterium]|nr:tryptophan--tRNA ligase [Parcubacteria group bacterium]